MAIESESEEIMKKKLLMTMMMLGICAACAGCSQDTSDTDTDTAQTEEVSTEAETEEADCFNPESGELVLGDIIISLEKVVEQAEKYGHSQKREYAFLIAHSMLHLMGYDHESPEEAKIMEARQAAILEGLQILR